MCVCKCVIPNQITSKKPHYMSELSKPYALLHKTHIKVFSGTKVPRLDMSRSILPLSKIAHQMWRDHPGSQRNRTTEKSGGGGCRGGVGNIGRSL